MQVGSFYPPWVTAAEKSLEKQSMPFPFLETEPALADPAWGPQWFISQMLIDVGPSFLVVQLFLEKYQVCPFIFCLLTTSSSRLNTNVTSAE